MSLSTLLLIVLGGSAGALIFAVGLSRWVMARDTGTPEMRKISDAIQEGAEAYLARQNKTIAMLAVLVAAVLAVGYGLLRTHNATDPVDDPKVFAMFITLSFLLGALSSGIAGYMGMWVSIRTNIRVAAAAMTSLNAALQTALRGGAVSGLFTVGMSILGVGGLFGILTMFAPAGLDAAAWAQKIPFLIVGYGFGASFVALFAQLGGGIYTDAPAEISLGSGSVARACVLRSRALSKSATRRADAPASDSPTDRICRSIHARIRSSFRPNGKRSLTAMRLANGT